MAHTVSSLELTDWDVGLYMRLKVEQCSTARDYLLWWYGKTDLSCESTLCKFLKIYLISSSRLFSPYPPLRSPLVSSTQHVNTT
jgi:hypothetical protein